MSVHAAPSGGHDASAPSGDGHDASAPATTRQAARARRGSWLGNPRHSATADGLLLALAAATAAVCLMQAHGAARLLLVLAAACLIPGSALLTRLRVEDAVEACGLAIGLGFAIEATGAVVMVWTGWWHPFGWALVLGAVACAVLAVDLRHNLSISRESA